MLRPGDIVVTRGGATWNVYARPFFPSWSRRPINLEAADGFAMMGRCAGAVRGRDVCLVIAVHDNAALLLVSTGVLGWVGAASDDRPIASFFDRLADT